MLCVITHNIQYSNKVELILTNYYTIKWKGLEPRIWM